MDTRPLPAWLSSQLKTPNHLGGQRGPSIGQGNGCLGCLGFLGIMFLCALFVAVLLRYYGVGTGLPHGLPDKWRASETPGYQYEFIPSTPEEYNKLEEIRRHNKELLNRRPK